MEKILIIEENQFLLKELEQAMQNSYVVEIFNFNNIKICSHSNPINHDFIIVNLNLLNVLKDTIFRTPIREFYNIPMLIISNYSQERTIIEASYYGVNHFVTIPFDFSKIPIIIQSICSNNKNLQTIDRLLIELGIVPNLLGFKYIKEAIIYLRSGESKQVYNHLSSYFRKDKICIERDIRHALEKGLNFGNQYLWQQLFKNNYFKGERPSNLEFLSTISEYLKCLYLK